MRLSLNRSTTRFIGLLLLIAAGGVTFQNCGTYQAGSSGIDLSTACDVDTSNCASVLLDEGILLQIGNTDLNQLNDQPYFDVGGFCDNGTYDGTISKIQYKMLNSDDSDVASSCNGADPDGACWNNALDASGAQARCVDGRFSFSVTQGLGAQGGLPAHASGAASLSILEVRLIEYASSTSTQTITNGVGRGTQTINVYISASN